MIQIFQNLVGNAVKYGGKKITISASQREGLWICSVADGGVGIPMEYGQQIFGLFKRLGSDGKGHGVGLAICRGFIERHGDKSG